MINVNVSFGTAVISAYEHANSLGLIRSGRAVGNTTRVVDAAIDLLFQGFIVSLKEEVMTERRFISDLIINRLMLEHQIDPNLIIVSVTNSTIELRCE